jgi:hypothetical protein
LKPWGSIPSTKREKKKKNGRKLVLAANKIIFQMKIEEMAVFPKEFAK